MCLKACRRCGKSLPLSEYYTHPRMLDGHLNICKECVKSRVSKHREENIDSVRAYDRERAKLPHRKNLNREVKRRRRKEVDGYMSAHNKIHRATASGKIERSKNCSICGVTDTNIEAHHFDYNQPTNVIWMCCHCHRQYHTGKTSRAITIQMIVNNIAELRGKYNA